MASMSFPDAEFSNVNVGNLRSKSTPISRRSMRCPPSLELRARRSGCQDRMPCASSCSRRRSSSPKIGRPGRLADCFSTKTSMTSSLCCLASSQSSEIWSATERTCRDLSSVDLRTYIIYLIDRVGIVVSTKLMLLIRLSCATFYHNNSFCNKRYNLINTDRTPFLLPGAVSIEHQQSSSPARNRSQRLYGMFNK